MDGRSVAQPRSSWRPLCVLLLLAAAIHTWQITHTVVAARDSIGFIRYAHRLEREPLLQVLRTTLHPPMYPLTVLGVSWLARPFFDVADPLVMQYCAQTASAVAGVLLVIPMFYLGRLLFDARVGFVAALVFQCLPVGSRALADGLTEGIYLLACATALLLAVIGMQRRQVWVFGLAGLCTGCAYLTRPEGLELPLAMLAVLLARPALATLQWLWSQPITGLSGLTLWLAGTASTYYFSRSLFWSLGVAVLLAGLVLIAAVRVRWWWQVACAAALVGGLLVVGLPYTLAIGGLTNKTSGMRMFDADAEAINVRPRACLTLPRAVRQVRTPLPLATWMMGWSESNQGTNLWWGAQALAKELTKSFNHVAWLPALLGLWWFRGRFLREPELWLAPVWAGIHLLLLMRLVVVAGYLSERHTILFVFCAAPWIAAGTFELARRCTQALPERRRLVELACVVILVGSCLPGALKPLHASRAGFRAAGLWLAQHSDPSDEIVDPFCWTHYYAGRVFLERDKPAVPAGHQPVDYTILDKSHHHSRLPALEAARRVAERGTPVYHWPTQKTLDDADIVVYASPR